MPGQVALGDEELAEVAAEAEVGAPAVPLGPDRGGYRDALARPAVRRLWGETVSGALGEAIAQVALPLLVYDLSGSARLLSLIFVLTMAAKVALAPLAGLLADRVDRRRLLLALALGRGGLVALLPLAGHVWQVAVLALLVAGGSALAKPAEFAAVPVVAGPALTVPALSLTQVSTAIVRVVGPAAGAGIVGLAGPAAAFWIQVACFAAAVACLSGLQMPPANAGSGRAGLGQVWAELREGLQAVWANRIVRGITLAECLFQSASTVMVVGLVVYTEQTLALGDRAGPTFALLTATFAAGAALGALTGGRLERSWGRRPLLALGYLGSLALLPTALVPPLPVTFGCLLLFGFVDACLVIAMLAYLAEGVPDRLRGRVYAGYTGVVVLAGALWYAAIGWVIPWLGAPRTIALAGLVVAGGGPLALRSTGALAAMRRLEAARG